MKLTRRDLQTLPLQSLHTARNWSKADVFGGERDGIRFVVKDFKRAPWWFKPFARSFLRREWKALRSLEGMAGVPRALARPDADAIVIEHAPGVQMQTMESRTVPRDSLLRLIELVQEIHQRGVTHGDLHQQNVLIDDDGSICLIDWATAHIWKKSDAKKRWLQDEFCALDRRALAKIKVHHGHDLVTDEDLRLLREGASRAYRAVKKVRGIGEKLRGKQHLGVLERKLNKIEEQRRTVDIDRTS